MIAINYEQNIQNLWKEEVSRILVSLLRKEIATVVIVTIKKHF